MNIVSVIQARTSSSRLPNKVLLPLSGAPLIIRMAERVMMSKLSGKVVVATSTGVEDDVIEYQCMSNNINCFRGHLTDLLDRHYQAGLYYKADAIVKIPSDCPLIDPQIIDKVIGYFIQHKHKFDFVSNLHPPTYPDGNDVEIMTANALKKAWKNATKPLEREHTTPYFWENPQMFSIGNVLWEKGVNYSFSHRWTIDYEEDYLFIKQIYDELYPVNPEFGINDILQLLELKPEIASINEKYKGRYWYENHMDELKTIRDYMNEKLNQQQSSASLNN